MSEKSPVESPASTVATGFLSGNGKSASEAQHERRMLTALCYDLVGSTNLLALLDIEDFQDLIAAFQQAARQAISSCFRRRQGRGRRRRRCAVPGRNRRQGRGIARHSRRAGNHRRLPPRRRRERPRRPACPGRGRDIDDLDREERYGQRTRDGHRPCLRHGHAAPGHRAAGYGGRLGRDAATWRDARMCSASGVPTRSRASPSRNGSGARSATSARSTGSSPSVG